jgi:opacity protein-like surface antigen
MRARLLLLSVLIGGCGVGALQTAKTTAQGSVDFTFAGGYVYNEMVDERGNAPTNFPQHIGVRYGVTEQMDVGGGLFLLAGAVADVKYNLVHNRSPLAVSVQGGLGAAANIDPHDSVDGWLLHVPVTVRASYRLWDRLTPYAGLGYGFCWIFDRSADTQPGERYADRAGHGDGLLMVTAGLELALTRRFAVLVEYDLWTPVVDDPGDFYAFSDNHMAFVGFRF